MCTVLYKHNIGQVPVLKSLQSDIPQRETTGGGEGRGEAGKGARVQGEMGSG